jgi:hypothetical protein
MLSNMHLDNRLRMNMGEAKASPILKEVEIWNLW